MDNLRRAIKVFFRDYCSDYVLRGKEQDRYINRHVFLENAFYSFKNYSLDEIENVYDKLDTDWFYDIHSNGIKSFFNLLSHFTSKVLVEENLEPFVEYKHLLKWRDLSFNLGEDILSTSFLACMDNNSQRHRTFFAWRGTIFSNNKRLHQILQKGLAENHFHLKGSGPVFDLSWINLMNHPTDFDKSFEELNKQLALFTKVSNAPHNSRKELKILVYKAAIIRQLLFRHLNGEKVSLEFDMSQDSNSSSSFELLIDISSVNKNIQTLRYTEGHRFSHNSHFEVIDYAIPRNLHKTNLDKSFVFCGERKLLYDCFKKIYSSDIAFEELIYLFHAYLLIKGQFRAELIQMNDKVGFGNFSKYQDRKEYFLPEDSIYHTAFINLAIHDTKKHIKIDSFEIRVAPKPDVTKLNYSLLTYNDVLRKTAIVSESELTSTDSELFDLKKNRIFYTLHYIKKKENLIYNDLSSEIICRHSQLRNEVKYQSIAIGQLRESYSKISELIRGIDAASSEFNAGPEVFAQGFRYVKNHKIKGKLNHLKEVIHEPKIYATYHAGEDFYDVVDGLRSIDECICFLNLSQGDRIGHALALGIEVPEYYNLKQNKLMLPKQVVLDNIVWLLAKIRKFGINIYPGEIANLEKLYYVLFHEIYLENFENDTFLKNFSFNHTTYFDAWKLRGDDPYLYLNRDQDVYKQINFTYWERCRINEQYPRNKNIRQNQQVKFLYQQYHFNPKIKEAGKKNKQFNITYAYMKLVEAVQQKMQHEIKNLNISIETNPTSNFLIGTFKRYAKHPIVNFYNLGLEVNNNTINNCPQISVSINTDDQGIFSTSLENEYALMAIALEKEIDLDGKPKYNPSMIYEWLERIRQLGIEQSFNS